MTSQGVMRAGTSGLSSHGGKLSKQIFKMATVPSTVESECTALLSCVLLLLLLLLILFNHGSLSEVHLFFKGP